MIEPSIGVLCLLIMPFQKGFISWNKGKKCPSISKAMKGRKLSEEHKEKLSLAHKGKKQSKETIEKRVKQFRGKKRPPFSKKWKKNLSIAHKGQEGYWLGKKRPLHSQKTKEKMSLAHKGEKSYLWKGGITPKNKKIRNNIKYRLWREEVFKRDNWTCVFCRKGNCCLNAHHIYSFANYLKLRFIVSNGITLCRECHQEFHNKYGRKNHNKTIAERTGVSVEFPNIDSLMMSYD